MIFDFVQFVIHVFLYPSGLYTQIIFIIITLITKMIALRFSLRITLYNRLCNIFNL